ncbi:MAG: tellurite resistance TerB family protein [Hyphomicrobiales bacterium]|nr:tellurite resistance TerB family protein [Hyphomicrobiales bacterium]
MAETVSSHSALIYVMVTMSAVDTTMTDAELRKIGSIIKTLPAFKDFDEDELVHEAEACGRLLSQEGGLKEVLDLIARSLPKTHYDTAYALAVEVAAADLSVGQEELRLLQMLRDRLNLDKLTIAAIERGARARYATL